MRRPWVKAVSAPDTGESTASIVAGTNQRGWEQILPKLRAGAVLKREPKVRRSYVDGWGGLTDTFVRRKVAAGELRQVSLDSWKLAPEQAMEASDG
jgi:hypothetical protein